jgi:DNA-binding NarL/FixJ family response regulator
MLSDILAEVLGEQPDMEVVGRSDNMNEMVSEAGHRSAEVVVVGLVDSALPDECMALLDDSPRVKVLGITTDGRRAFLYELQPQRSALGEVSPEGLINAIRGLFTPARRADAGSTASEHDRVP